MARVAVPRANVVPKPSSLSFAEAACLPTAWLTAYRMLFTRARLQPGATVLVQGAGGGVATALVVLVMFVFLQSWRATLIPLLAVPVSLVHRRLLDERSPGADRRIASSPSAFDPARMRATVS